jgi:hypothetical protein
MTAGMVHVNNLTPPGSDSPAASAAPGTRSTVSSSSLAALVRREELQHLPGVHARQAHVVRVDHGVGHVQLEALQPHDVAVQKLHVKEQRL